MNLKKLTKYNPSSHVSNSVNPNDEILVNLDAITRIERWQSLPKWEGDTDLCYGSVIYLMNSDPLTVTATVDELEQYLINNSTSLGRETYV